ncbi:MAG TPA: sialate O-acetylesterase [Lacibacter sp.]|nr:sialate O-acetylesterase [Lacibacter sp.]
MRKHLLIIFLFIQVSFSCNKRPSAGFTGYDIFLIGGQSNAFYGKQSGRIENSFDLRILQLGRHNTYNYRLLLAIDPLHHHQIVDSAIGFAWTFASLYADEYLEKSRKVLLIPCASSASGFLNNQWNRGNPLFTDAIDRVNYCLKTYPGSRIKGILWHQGESDVSFGDAYRRALDAMVINLRTAIDADDNQTIPFVAGGLVPYLTERNPSFRIIDSIIRDLPLRVQKTAFADPLKPSVIRKPDDTVDAIHFNADGQREMGLRYFNSYKTLIP